MMKTFSKSIAFAAIFSLALFPFTSMAQPQEQMIHTQNIDTLTPVLANIKSPNKPEVDTYYYCIFTPAGWICI